MAGHASGGADDPFERIVPRTLNPTISEPAATASVSKRLLAWRLPAAFGLLVSIVLVVLFWLPKTVSQPTPMGVKTAAKTAAPPSASPTSQLAPTESPAQVEAMLQQRQRAEALAARWHELQAKLTAMQVSQWAAEDAAALAQQAQQADARFTAREYAAAIDGYAQAIRRAGQLQARAREVLATALADGRDALQAGDAATAAQAFARAISIDADNAEALAGQRRARNFDAVRAQLNKAAAAQSQGDLASARAGFQRVLALDAENPTARAGLAKLQAAAANTAFAAQMSRGLTALERSDYAAAQAAFNAALQLRAGAPAARDGLERARLGLQSARVQSLRETAQQAEQDEQWRAARAAYAAALTIDSSLAFAQQGLQRAERRAALAARMQSHIEHASRLSASSVRADAGAALAEAAAISAPGPRLRAQMQQLSGLIARATTPVDIALRSDGKTQVIVYPIGALGQFETRSLSLTPGQYTAIGRRPGYREVRVPFVVTGDGVANVPIIQCEEPI